MQAEILSQEYQERSLAGTDLSSILHHHPQPFSFFFHYFPWIFLEYEHSIKLIAAIMWTGGWNKLEFLVVHQCSDACSWISFYMRKIHLYLLKLLIGFLMLSVEHNPQIMHHISEMAYTGIYMTKFVFSRCENLIILTDTTYWVLNFYKTMC